MTSNGSPTLACRDLVKVFDRRRVVDALSFEARPGTIVGLLGPNGSGKTTTIRTCLGIYRPDGGSVALLGASDPLSVRHRVGYLPEERGLYARMKVREQLAFLASIRGLSLADSDRRAGEWLERVGLADRDEARTGELSKGMQQKVQFAAAVIHEPALVVLDEPFSGLDPINARLLQDLILEQRNMGTTVILSTHQMDQVEALCESICLIAQGRVVLNGRLATIKAEYGRNTLAVEYQGSAGRFEQLPGVRHVEDTGRHARLALEPHADVQRLMRAVLDRVEVVAMTLDEPHIEEIYLDKVGGVRAAGQKAEP
jgi:ABC-2 type transport system ATP-binding protein